MNLLATPFDGLSAADFEVYAPNCWSSNLHNRQRMETKQRVLALARAMAERLDEGGLQLEASSEIPSVWNGRKVQDQWAYLFRDADTRKSLQAMIASRMDMATRIADPAEHHRHALICVRLDHEALEVGLRINRHASLDLGNLLARGADAALDALLDALPEGVKIGEAKPSASALLEAARAAQAGEAEWVVLARRVEQAAAEAAGLELAEQVAEVAAAVLPIYTWLCWSAENDHIDAASELDELAARRDKAHEDEAAAKAAKVEEHRQRAEQARARTEARVADLSAWREARGAFAPRDEGGGRRVRPEDAAEKPAKADTRLGGRSPSTPTERRARPPRKKREESAEAPRKSAKGRVADKPTDPKAPGGPALPVGTRVRLTRGLLAGKEGEITGKDKRGYYRVRVGALEVSVNGTDLESME